MSIKLYNAGIYTTGMGISSKIFGKLDSVEQKFMLGNEHYLESYHYINRQSKVNSIRKDKKRVFLDSGAFSAFSLGAKIDVGKYCAYIDRNLDIIEFPSVLDAIGDHAGTWRNQNEMEKRGIRPLPCAHYGEPPEVVKYYAENYDHITLGGLVPISTKQMILWLDEVFEKYICDENGFPKIKVHGFGVTSLPIMLRYPWHSVDSSTWIQWGSNGMILLPGSGKQIDISNRSSRRKMKNQHIDSVSDIERFALETEIETEDIDPDRLREHYYSRWAWNAWAFPEFLNRRELCTQFVREQKVLF